MQKITPFLWFDSQAEEAARFYVSVFRNSRITTIARYGEAGPGPAGSVMTIGFELDGVQFTALNGGPHLFINGGISFVVHCDSQAEVDDYWDKLTGDGGEPGQCAWLKDRFGVSWQIVPDVLMTLLSDPDKAKSQRVMQAMLQMTRIDIAALERAAAG